MSNPHMKTRSKTGSRPRQSTQDEIQGNTQINDISISNTNVNSGNVFDVVTVVEDDNNIRSISATLVSTVSISTTLTTSSSKRPPIFGWFDDEQLELASTVDGFLALAPHNDRGEYRTLTVHIKGTQGSPFQCATYTQLELKDLWDDQDTRPLVVIGVRGTEEVNLFFQQVTLEEIWSLGRSNNAMPLSTLMRISDEELRRRHDAQSKVRNVDQLINKTNMQACYRLEGHYLKALPAPRDGTCLVPRNGTWITVKCKLYWERDVEIMAWKMNGRSAANFVKFLLNRYQVWSTTIRKKKEEKEKAEKFKIALSYKGLFTMVWHQKYRGQLYDSIEFVPPPGSARLTPLALEDIDGPRPLPPPSERRNQSSSVAGPSTQPM